MNIKISYFLKVNSKLRFNGFHHSSLAQKHYNSSEFQKKMFRGMSVADSRKYTLVPDYTLGGDLKKIDRWMPYLSYFTYNLGSNYSSVNNISMN